MDNETKENWLRIQTYMESLDKTDNMFYRRAVAINTGGSDPLVDPAVLVDFTGDNTEWLQLV